MKTIDDLKTMKEQSSLHMRRGIRIQVGMGTCGLAAGAKRIYDFFVDALLQNEIEHAYVTQVGCMGECAFEPLVEVVDLDGHSIIYCKVNKKMVDDIVESHIKNGKKLEKYSLYRFKK